MRGEYLGKHDGRRGQDAAQQGQQGCGGRGERWNRMRTMEESIRDRPAESVVKKDTKKR